MTYHGTPNNQSPFNALPPVVVALAVVIAGIELIFQAGAAGFVGGQEGILWRTDAIRDWAVAGSVLTWMRETGQTPPGELARFVTYPLLHIGFGHAAFVCVFVLAFGNVLSPVYRGWRVAALFFGAALAAGVVYAVIFARGGPLFGGYPGAYGLVGAFAYLTRRGMTRARPDQAFLLVGFLLAIQPIFGLATGGGLAWVPDWTADLVGAAAGYGLAHLMFPGQIGRLRDRMRQR